MQDVPAGVAGVEGEESPVSETSWVREPPATEAAGDQDVQGHAGLNLVIAGQEAGQGVSKRVRLDRSQVTEMAEIDAEHRHPDRAHQVHGAQHGAVPTEADGQIEVGRPLAVAGSGPVRIEKGGHVALPPQPGRGLLGQPDGARSLGVRDETDGSHAHTPDQNLGGRHYAASMSRLASGRSFRR